MSRILGVAAFEYGRPAEESFRRVRALGLSHCELGNPADVTPENAGQVAELAQRHGVQVTAVANLAKINSSDDIPAMQKWIIDSVRCAAGLGAPFVITYFGGHPTRPHDEAIKRYTEAVQPCLEAAERHGVTILIENHFSHAPGEVTNTADGCLELIERIGSPRFGLNFDPCNFAVGAEEYYPYAYQRLQKHIRNVHVKDARKYRAAVHGPYAGRIVHDLRQGDFIFCRVGDGAVNNDPVLRALVRDGFSGSVTIEAHTPADTLDAVFRAGIEFCRERGI